MFNVTYENDTYMPLSFLPFVPRYDGGDRWRTASFRLQYGYFEIGMILHTGEATDPRLPDPNATRQNPNVMTGGTIDDPDLRSGIVYVGTANFRIGVNHDRIRHFFQNDLAHDFWNHGRWGSSYPWVRDIDEISNPWLYLYIGTGYADSNY